MSTAWTVFQFDSFWNYDAVPLLLFPRNAQEKKQMFVVAGLLNVKTVEERCTRSAFCTTTSFGHQGKSWCGSWTTTQKHMQSVFDIYRIHATTLCIYWKSPVLKLNWSWIFFLLALSVITVLKSLAKQERRTSFQPEVSYIS